MGTFFDLGNLKIDAGSGALLTGVDTMGIGIGMLSSAECVDSAAELTPLLTRLRRLAGPPRRFLLQGKVEHEKLIA